MTDRPRHAIVLADGGRATRAELDAAWPGWDEGVDLVVAADGGARLAEELGLPIDLWVGDGDSLDPAALDRLRAAGIPLEPAREDKDESDTELAVLAAAGRGAEAITILGALGGPRLDHALANVGLLAHAALSGRPVRLVDPTARVTLLRGPGEATLEGRAGDVVSLLPLGGDASGVVTEGLRYPLLDEPLPAGPARGLSNVRLTGTVRVGLRGGRLLIVESPASLSP